jgi:hypothetical protein
MRKLKMSASEPSDMHRIPDAVSPGPSPKARPGPFLDLS